MGLRSRLSHTDGSVSAEAAIGIGVIIIVMVALIQALGLGLWHMRARAALTEAVRVATASGEPEVQIGLAREFLKTQLPGATLSSALSDEGIRLEVRRQIEIPLLSWAPTVRLAEFGHWQDPWLSPS